jgi:hydrogenase/urease accessory protein HupE
MKRLPGLFAVLLITACAAASVNAHEVRPAYLEIVEEVTNDDTPLYRVLWKQPIVQAGRLAIDPIFPADCPLNESDTPEVTPSALIHRWLVACDLSDAKIHIQGLSRTLTDVMVRFTDQSGNVANYILRPENPTLDLASEEASTFSYLIIGIEHLVFGIDHVLFVIGLILFIRDPWMLLKTVTAFTVAHSITLALSVLGWVQLDQGPVEAVIALSILFLARELVQEESKRSALTRTLPWAMAFIFGLLHGLGFAGALRDVGLPEDSLWLALLLFNVGIELGQLLIIAMVFALGWALRRLTQIDTLTRIVAYGMGCIAAYWTIDRALLLM